MILFICGMLFASGHWIAGFLLLLVRVMFSTMKELHA